MAQSAQGKYYAQTTSVPAVKDDNTAKEIIDVSVTGGDESTYYKCTGTLKISKGASDMPAAEGLTAGDVVVQLGGASTEKIDLTELKSAESVSKTLTFSGINTSTPAKLTAQVWLENTASEQNYLADKTLSLTFNVSEFTCDTAAE